MAISNAVIRELQRMCERPCCGTLKGSPHRSTCPMFKRKKKAEIEFSRRVYNSTRIRWSLNRNSKRPYVVERHENCIQHIKNGVVQSLTFTVRLVGRYETEGQANSAAMDSAIAYGGFAYRINGICMGWFNAPKESK